MTELKRCPFCGWEAVFSIKNDFSRNLIKGYEFNIRCNKCNVTNPNREYRIEFRMNDSGEIEIIHDERKDAIEAWNKRYKED
jgi:Lar family restriction alleviation protein